MLWPPQPEKKSTRMKDLSRFAVYVSQPLLRFAQAGLSSSGVLSICAAYKGRLVTIQQTTVYVPPALRSTRPKHAGPASAMAKRFAGGALLSAAIAGGFAAAPLAGFSGLGNTGTAQAACAPNDFL